MLGALSDDPRLGPKVAAAIEAPTAEVLVSAGSLWEIALPIVTGDPAFADYDVTVIWD